MQLQPILKTFKVDKLNLKSYRVLKKTHPRVFLDTLINSVSLNGDIPPDFHSV